MIKILRLRSILFAVVVNLFIFFCICRSIFMCWPFDQQYNPRIFLRPFDNLSSFLALNAELALFSPNPPMTIEELKFVVNFDDGTSEEWEFPRDKMTPWDSDRSYPVYVRNAILWSTRRALIRARPYEARYIARQAATGTKRPVRVDFLVSRLTIPPPDVGMGKDLIHGQQFERFFSYVVKPGDLN
jgi:hypothetical protein